MSWRNELPPTLAVTCVVWDASGEATLKTYPYSGCSREAVSVVTPENGTMVPAGTYTGRFPSLTRKNCGVVDRFRSVTPYWLVPMAYDASRLAL